VSDAKSNLAPAESTCVCVTCLIHMHNVSHEYVAGAAKSIASIAHIFMSYIMHMNEACRKEYCDTCTTPAESAYVCVT